MTITLTPKQQAWIDAHVASGEFASAEAAAHSLIDVGIFERAMLDADDLAWAKPLVDEALAEIERGETETLEEHQAGVRAFLATLKR